MPLPYQLGDAAVAWDGDEPRSSRHGDIYWSAGKAVEEKRFVFLTPFMRQTEKVAAGNSLVCCAELGFGFGVNCLLTCGHWSQAHPDARLDYISIEKHPVSHRDLSRLLATLDLPLADTLASRWPVPVAGTHVIWLTRNIRLLLVLDDVNSALADLDAKVDAWYLDGFSPASNQEMWADDLYRKMFARSVAGATVATYSASGKVRRGLASAGFEVRKTAGFGGKHEMLVASRPGAWTPRAGKAEMPGKIAIVGGGLAGHFCAEALARRGLEPAIIDNGKAGPSRVPQLAVFPQLAARPEPRHRFSLLAHQYMQDCPGFEPSGVAFYPRSDEESGRLQRIAAQFSNNFIEWRGSHLWFESGGWWSLGAFLDQNTFETVTFETVTADVSSIKRHGDSWRLFDGAAEVARAGVVILATGADKRLIGAEPEIRLVRGQAITLPTEKILSVTTGPVSIFPTANGRSTITGTYARGADDRPREEDTKQLLAAASGHIDTPADADIETHVGIRAASRDRLPVVDAMPDWGSPASEPGDKPGLYICAAFGSRGATHARLCSEYLASRILGEPSPLGKPHRKLLSALRFRRRGPLSAR